jgi:hypothetical protein
MDSVQVCVTLENIAAGLIGDCYRCPVALALAEATGDRKATVYGSGRRIWLEVNGRAILALPEVREFVRDFDALPRGADGRPDVAHERYRPLEPFAFTLPGPDDPEWWVACSRCGDLSDPSRRGADGECAECRAEDEES